MSSDFRFTRSSLRESEREREREMISLAQRKVEVVNEKDRKHTGGTIIRGQSYGGTKIIAPPLQPTPLLIFLYSG